MLAHFSHFLEEKRRQTFAAVEDTQEALEQQPADEHRRAAFEAARREHAGVLAAQELLRQFVHSLFVLY